MIKAFKWLVPDVFKFIDDVVAISRYGFGVTFTWESGQGWSGQDMETLLRRHGVRVYNRRYSDEEGKDYSLTVRTKQARFAERVMRGEGAPLTSPLYDKSNRYVQAGQRIQRKWMDKPGGKPMSAVGFVGNLVDWLS